MTPKEKAIELIDKYSSWVRDYDIPKYSIINQKQCALIAVDEILKAAFYATDEIYNHYLEVKQEIENL